MRKFQTSNVITGDYLENFRPCCGVQFYQPLPLICLIKLNIINILI